jgi:hypothetical protein
LNPEQEPRAKLSGRKLINYNYWHGARPGRKDLLSDSSMDAAQRPYSNFGSGSRKRLKECLSRWFDTITISQQFLRVKNIVPLKFHTFVTCTLSAPQLHCDKTINREILNHFIINLKRHHRVQNYLWKAELQENGNIHYHILTDRYIDWRKLRDLWNSSQERLNYISRFEEKHKHRDPNSTDIHALQKIKNVHAYIGKYMSKDSTARVICGHTWGRSDNLIHLQSFTFHNDFEFHEWTQMQLASINHEVITGENFCLTSFHQKINLRTLPAHHMRTMKEIARANLDMLHASK